VDETQSLPVTSKPGAYCRAVPHHVAVKVTPFPETKETVGSTGDVLIAVINDDTPDCNEFWNAPKIPANDVFTELIAVLSGAKAWVVALLKV
jgi:hypothetical protein